MKWSSAELSKAHARLMQERGRLQRKEKQKDSHVCHNVIMSLLRRVSRGPESSLPQVTSYEKHILHSLFDSCPETSLHDFV